MLRRRAVARPAEARQVTFLFSLRPLSGASSLSAEGAPTRPRPAHSAAGPGRPAHQEHVAPDGGADEGTSQRRLEGEEVAAERGHWLWLAEGCCEFVWFYGRVQDLSPTHDTLTSCMYRETRRTAGPGRLVSDKMEAQFNSRHRGQGSAGVRWSSFEDRQTTRQSILRACVARARLDLIQLYSRSTTTHTVDA